MKRIASLALVLAAAACAEGGRDAATPPTLPAVAAAAPAPEARFLRRAPGAPAFARDAAVLEAAAGAAGEATLRFADGSPLAAFRVTGESLRGATIGGRPLLPGETVRITLASADPARFVVSLEPSGLVFNPAAPAELVVFHRHADARGARGPLAAWKQEKDGEPWTRVAGSDEPGRFRISVGGFTKYAVASGRASEHVPW